MTTCRQGLAVKTLMVCALVAPAGLLGKSQ
jgi:hypothetical protein